ncbi:uncharacterized protein TRIADDRAFT_59581 [Trichoplax adhaerens]|uniref:Death domain-containing protein n=1 Tax=Trichoplax adhaerens TaxID=10228 RepID=B3S620_TRIAD|nr:predicted protein [Trichoplax adhaerens]EDV22018.1 predicted protein [Trichoplax adhaerens]|eukprot:XP_002115655.1 predicted protein [Trichoplax adhaerens]
MVLSNTIRAILDSNFQRIAKETPLLELLFDLRTSTVFTKEEIASLRQCDSLRERHHQFLVLFRTKTDADFRQYYISLQNHRSKNVQKFGQRLETEAIAAFKQPADATSHLNISNESEIGYRDPRPYFPVVAEMIGIKWMKLSRTLDYEIPSRLIDSECKSQCDKAVAALNSWYDKHGQGATVNKLKVALYEIGRKDIAEKIGSSKDETTAARYSRRISIPDTMQIKEYYFTYVKALKRGQCQSDFIRIMFIGPENVGKTTIMRILIEEIRVYHSAATQVVENTGKMVDFSTFKIYDGTQQDYFEVLKRKIQGAVEDYKEKQIDMPNFDEIESLSSPRNETNRDDNDNLSDHIKETKAQRRQIIRKFFKQHLRLTEKFNIDRNQYGKLWDFGGQAVYHVTHQPFISGNSLYILVFNIAESIGNKVKARGGKEARDTYLDRIKEWLTSVIGCSNSNTEISVKRNNQAAETYRLPVVILVATHGDEIEGKQDPIATFDEFTHKLVEQLPSYKANICSSRIIFDCGEENYNTSAKIEERLRRREDLLNIIKTFAQALPFVNKPIPTKWYFMATLLHSQENGIKNIMTTSEIKEVAIDYGLYERNMDSVEDDQELIDMLLYLHDIGELLFYREEITKENIVITNVEWLVKIFRALIVLEGSKTITSADTLEDYNIAYTTGKVSKRVFDNALSPFNLIDDDKERVLKIMEHYNIICEIKVDVASSNCIRQFIVPYLLRPNVTFTTNKEEEYVSGALFMGFNKSNIPYISDGIFYCLVAACMKKWNNQFVKLCYKCAKYYIRQSDYYMIIKKSESYISLEYSYQILNENEDLKVRQAIEVQRPQFFIMDTFKKIINDRMPRFQAADCSLYVTCCMCGKLTSQLSHEDQDHKGRIRCQKCNFIFDSPSLDQWGMKKKDIIKKEELSSEKAVNFIKCFDIIAEKLDQKCLFRFATKLGLEVKDIDEITMNSSTSYDKVLKVLDRWHQNLGSKADIWQVTGILRNIGNVLAAEIVEEHLCSQN